MDNQEDPLWLIESLMLVGNACKGMVIQLIIAEAVVLAVTHSGSFHLKLSTGGLA